jgi:hypothetical protein
MESFWKPIFELRVGRGGGTHVSQGRTQTPHQRESKPYCQTGSRQCVRSAPNTRMVEGGALTVWAKQEFAVVFTFLP